MAKRARVKTVSGAWVDIAQSVTDLSNYPSYSANQFGFRNKIINGDFRINQRAYVSNTFVTTGTYMFDRWKANNNNTALVFTSAPQGQSVTVSGSRGIQQVIERANMPAGTYVLSWTGTAVGRVYNSGATAPSYAASPVLVTIDGTADVVVELASPTSTATTIGLVQLEQGTVASKFEYRPIGAELALCQRYYVRFNYVNGDPICTAGAWFTNQAYGVLHLPVFMRSKPTTCTLSGATILQYLANGTGAISTASTSTGSSAQSIELNGTYSSITNPSGGWFRSNGTSWIDASAEL